MADRVLMGHGAGGRLSATLVRERFLPALGNPVLSQLMDSAVLEDDLAFTTDAYVVSPRVFPGGDLGRLAVSGTVNDLCMVGAVPLALSAAFILEEGLLLDEVERCARSMAATAEEAGVAVVAGDTKVVPHGACDGMFVTTAGIGRLGGDFRPRPERARPGDVVIVSGTLADHGVAVLACREGIRLGGAHLVSDVAPLTSLTAGLRASALDVHSLRDPTRGGVAQSLVEIATAARVRIVLREEALPVAPPVRAACELLGLDPLYVANEGKMLLVVPAAQADAALAALRGHPLGRNAVLIGQVEEGAGCEVRSALGGRRALRPATGELLPRIC
jgi:hydrogenase expression/formation protein HypE